MNFDENQAVRSIKAMAEEYLHGDTARRARVLREMAGYTQALLDMGHEDVAIKVSGIIRTLMHTDS